MKKDSLVKENVIYECPICHHLLFVLTDHERDDFELKWELWSCWTCGVEIKVEYEIKDMKITKSGKIVDPPSEFL